MQRLEVSGAVRPIYESLGVKRLKKKDRCNFLTDISQFIGKSNPDIIQRSETMQLINIQ